MFGRIKFIDLGRNNFSGEVVIKNEDSLWKEIKKHLRSSDIEYLYDEDKNLGTVFAGMRAVGEFISIEVKEKREKESQTTLEIK